MGRHRHEFVNNYNEDSVAFGISRDIDEKSFIAFLQKFTDGDLMNLLVKRLPDAELISVVDFVTGILRRHLAEDEYHQYFLKDKGHP